MIKHRTVEYDLIVCNKCGRIYAEYDQHDTLHEQVKEIRRAGWYVKYENAVRYDASKVLCPNCVNDVCGEWCDHDA